MSLIEVGARFTVSLIEVGARFTVSRIYVSCSQVYNVFDLNCSQVFSVFDLSCRQLYSVFGLISVRFTVYFLPEYLAVNSLQHEIQSFPISRLKSSVSY